MTVEPARPGAAEEQARAPGGARIPFRLSLAVVAVCAAIVAAVSVDVEYDGWFTHEDPHVARWAYTTIPRALHNWLWRLTHFGDSWFLALLTAGAAVWLVARRRRWDAAVLGGGAALTGVVTTLLKLSFRRPRPPFIEPSHVPRSFSYPSGHASGAFVVYVLVALMLTARRGTWVRAAAVTAGLAVALTVAVTRALIPVHFLTDVLAGSALGLGMAALAWIVHVALERRR